MFRQVTTTKSLEGYEIDFQTVKDNKIWKDMIDIKKNLNLYKTSTYYKRVMIKRIK